MASKKEIKSKAKKAGKLVLKTTKNLAAKTGKSIVANPKSTAYVLVGLVGVFAVYKIYKVFNTSFEGDTNIDNQVEGTGGSTSGATISNKQARNYAQQLLDAMNEKAPLYGTDEQAIEAVFAKLKVGEDFIKVYNAFGKKDYNGNNSPPTGVWSYLDSYEPRDLVYWLRSEISPSSDAKTYKIVKHRIESTDLFVF